MDKFLARLFKSKTRLFSFNAFLLFFIPMLISSFFFHNIKFTSENIYDNSAWAQFDPNQDSDNDGISDKLESEWDPNRDIDKDGIKDYLDNDTCTMPTATDKGLISLQLWLFDVDANRIIEGQETIHLTECSAIRPEDTDLPSSYGDFPYGLWECKVQLPNEFEHERYRIFLEIYFPGPTNPLNSEYWTREYRDNTIEWVEFKKEGLYVSDIQKRSEKLELRDTWINEDQETIYGYGDQDKKEYIIDHVGGLLWPIPGEGRCFIDILRSL